MLQPGGLQRMVEPAKKKKMPNVQFKTAWKFPETGGKSLVILYGWPVFCALVATGFDNLDSREIITRSQHKVSEG